MTSEFSIAFAPFIPWWAIAALVAAGVALLAVTLMPPTLVGAVYGMNFKHMPELEWLWGYPMSLAVMLLSAVLPYIYFRWRGWI